MHASTSELRLRALDFAPLAAAIAVAGDHGVEIRYANGAFHALYRIQERPLSRELFAGASGTGPNAVWRGAVRQRRAALVRGPAQAEDGHVFRLEVQVHPLAGEGAALFLREASDTAAMEASQFDDDGPDAELIMAALEASQDALAQRDAEAVLLLDSFPGVAMLVDADGAVRVMGGEALSDLGVPRRPPPDAIDRGPLADAFPHKAGKALTELAESALAGKRARFSFFCAGRAFDGLAAPVRLEDGEIDGVLLALTDVTDRNEAYRALEAETAWRRR